MQISMKTIDDESRLAQGSASYVGVLWFVVALLAQKPIRSVPIWPIANTGHNLTILASQPTDTPIMPSQCKRTETQNGCSNTGGDVLQLRP